jgi:hypothetical protein
MRLARLATTGLLSGGLLLGAAACGSSSTGSSSSSAPPPPSSAAPAAAATPMAEIPNLTGVDTAVELDPQLLPTLTSLKVTPMPTGNGKLTMTYGPTLDFPITGGNVKVFDKSVTPYVQGIIHHQGSGLSFTAGGKTLTVENFDVDPGASILYAQVKEMSDAKIPLFKLDGTNLQITKDPQGHYKLDGTKVLLTADAAMAMNQYFGVQAFKEDFPIGTAHITAAG